MSRALRRRLSALGAPVPAAGRWHRVTPGLLVGPVLDRRGYLGLERAGVSHVIDLRAEAADDPDPAASLGFAWLGIPIVDRRAPSAGQFRALADWVAAAGPGAVVYVHCQGGLERSPSVAMALLVSAGYDLSEARAAVTRAHPRARPTAAQEAWLATLARGPEATRARAGGENPHGYTHRPNAARESDGR